LLLQSAAMVNQLILIILKLGRKEDMFKEIASEETKESETKQEDEDFYIWAVSKINIFTVF
jgi:hypothetical protein